MASCEKCWSDAYRIACEDGTKSQTQVYWQLLLSRDCTPEEQAGKRAQMCPNCNRKTVHQVDNICLVCGYKFKGE